MINAEELKKKITIDQVYDLLSYLKAEPELKDNIIISKTICHHREDELDNANRKLYYYQNDDVGIFHCYTACSPSSFDIFQLMIKIKKHNEGVEWTVIDAARFLNDFFNLNFEEQHDDKKEQLEDWNYFERWSKEEKKYRKTVEFNNYSKDILANFPRPRILNWEREGITKEICDIKGICYDPKNDGIIIPHYDINGNLIGIRERTLIKEEENNGKYRPAYINNKLWNHPLGFNLYNLNFSKDNIKTFQTAIVFESEKSCLQYASYFGAGADITCAICGSNFSDYQYSLLRSLDIKEIVIALDKQYQVDSGEEWARWTKKFIDINHKFGKYNNFSFIVDREGLLDYKDSPTDKGAGTFIKLYNLRETIK